MNKFHMFMTETEEIQGNIVDRMTVRRVEKEINQSEGLEFSTAAIKRIIQRAKEIFDEKNIIYPEGY